MEAGSCLRYGLICAVAGLLTCLSVSSARAANHRTQNFLIDAPTQQLAVSVGQAAEKYRRELAVHWLGAPLRPWPAPCPVRVVAGANLAAQGVTTYNRSPVRDFQMEVVGTPERILDSVLPHEVTHTILATHFGRPLPRWADEGICTTVEHASERSKHETKLREFLRSRRGIAMNRLFLLTEYPNDVLPMYAQGYSVCRFLIDQKGPQTFIRFLHDYMQRPSWTDSVKKHYDYDSLAQLQEYWLAWVAAGSGEVDKFAKVQPDTVPATETLAGPTVQASATQPLALESPTDGQPAPLSQASVVGEGNAAALASNFSQGWYQRKRLEAKSRDLGEEPLDRRANPIVPPSIRNSGRYRSAQPQPEQQISRSAAPLQQVSGSPDAARRF